MTSYICIGENESIYDTFPHFMWELFLNKNSTTWIFLFKSPYISIWFLPFFLSRFRYAVTALREKWPNKELFLVRISCIWTEYGDIRSKSPYSVWIQEYSDQKKLRILHFSRWSRRSSSNLIISRLAQIWVIKSELHCTISTLREYLFQIYSQLEPIMQY